MFSGDEQTRNSLFNYKIRLHTFVRLRNRHVHLYEQNFVGNNIRNGRISIDRRRYRRQS